MQWVSLGRVWVAIRTGIPLIHGFHINKELGTEPLWKWENACIVQTGPLKEVETSNLNILKRCHPHRLCDGELSAK